MTEESNEDAPTLEKLSIDKPSDFQFHAAYLVYSDIYSKTTNPETKKQLNQNIVALQQNQIDYHAFYRNINQFRTEAGSNSRFGRAQIKTQKKREWRRKSQKRERNKRHRK